MVDIFSVFQYHVTVVVHLHLVVLSMYGGGMYVCMSICMFTCVEACECVQRPEAFLGVFLNGSSPHLLR